MKQRQILKASILFLFCFIALISGIAAQDSAVAAEPTVKLRYFVNNNTNHYLTIETGLKEGRKFTPLPNQVVKLFLDSSSSENLIAKTYTDGRGRASVFIPASLKDKWNSGTSHSFIAVLEATSVEDERTTKIDVSKAKISIDTVNTDGTRSISAMVSYLQNDEWVPAGEVEVKVGIRRMGSFLPAGEALTYTTDSSGTITLDFNKDSMPGDQKGNIILAAQVEDDEHYGNLIVEKTVPWGVVPQKEGNFFNQRTLWSTRSGTPWWLLLMATSIVVGVWGTIVYLIIQLVKINKLSTVLPGLRPSVSD